MMNINELKINFLKGYEYKIIKNINSIFNEKD